MDYEKILFADNKLEENFEAEKPQETLEETCHLDYGYVLNESERLTEVEIKKFGDAIYKTLKDELDAARKQIAANGGNVSPNDESGAFPIRDLQRYADTKVPEMIDNFQHDGIFQNNHDGEQGYLVTDQKVLTDLILKYAKEHQNNPNCNLGRLYKQNAPTFERMIPYIVDRYFLSADTYKILRQNRKIN